MRDAGDLKNQYYTPVCMDGTSSVFWRQSVIGEHGFLYTEYFNGKESHSISNNKYIIYAPEFQTKLDEWVGNPYCGTWPKYLS